MMLNFLKVHGIIEIKFFLLDKIHWLTLPIEKQKLHTPLNKTVIKNKDTFKTNIKSKIINAYKDCPKKIV